MPGMTKSYIKYRKKKVLEKQARGDYYDSVEESKRRKEEYTEEDDTRKRVT